MGCFIYIQNPPDNPFETYTPEVPASPVMDFYFNQKRVLLPTLHLLVGLCKGTNRYIRK